MKRSSWLAAAAALLVLAVAVAAAPGIGSWYHTMASPRLVKPLMGATIWAAPANSVRASSSPADVAMPRNDAARLLMNPVPSSAESIERGNRAYHLYCAACHGPDAHGDGPMAARLLVPPPNLAANLWRRADGYLYETIRDGGPIMPSQRERIPPQERWDIVNYLRSIAAPAPEGVPAPPSAPTSVAPRPSQESGAPQVSTAAPVRPSGDVARGKAVFEGHCQICHNVDSREDLVGPGLKDLFRWPAHTLSDGTEHPAHNVDVIRRQIVEGGGSMAPVGASFSDQEIADLLAYLQTL